MAQKALPYEYEIEENKTGLTSVGGVPTYLDLAALTGVAGLDRPASEDTDRGLRLDGPASFWGDLPPLKKGAGPGKPRRNS